MGSPKKAAHITATLGYDAAVDYKKRNVSQQFLVKSRAKMQGSLVSDFKEHYKEAYVFLKAADKIQGNNS